MLLTTALCVALAALSPAPRDGGAVVRAMHDRYAGHWYRTLTFVQKTSRPDGTVETWYEALAMPGRLRIDIAPLDSGRALIFRDDSLFVLSGGRVTQRRALVHPLLLLGFDVYFLAPEVTLRKLVALGVDLGTVHEDTLDGRAMYVVGARKGDLRSTQFWVDAERLYFVRWISVQPNGAVSDTRFERYERLDGGWVAPAVVFLRDGKDAGREDYTQLHAGVALDDAMWNPDAFERPAWLRDRP